MMIYRYQSLPINSINDALNEYEKCVQNEISKRPVPPYIEDSIQKDEPESVRRRLDTCFHLIKLYCDANYPIEDVIAPLNHTSDQLDYRLRFAYY